MLKRIATFIGGDEYKRYKKDVPMILPLKL